MIRTGQLFRKELLEAVRDRRFSILLTVALALALMSSLDGWQRTVDDMQHRAAARDADRIVWLGQSETNPHDAAHFGRYAFRSVAPLSAFDSGITPYTGSAVWMEAHFQNPASLRQAEDIVLVAPLTNLTPAWVIRVLGSLALLTMLFGAVSRERESGTLRSLVASNVRSSQVVLAKSLAAMSVVGVLCITIVLLVVVPAGIFLNEYPDLDRLLLIALTYFIGLAGFAFLILAFSAMIATSKTALLASSGLWLLMCFVIPSIGSQFAEAKDPTPRAREFAAAIETQAQQPFWIGPARYETVAVYEAEVMTKHRALTFASLGFNRDALVLQAHERFANPVFDRIYGDLERIHQQQDRTLRYFAVLSPILALERISSGIAGTDRLAQRSFVEAAESSRRKLVKQMNEDMLINAGEDGFEYLAHRELWRKVDDFDYLEPELSEVLRAYLFELAVLVGWLLIGYIAAHFATKRLLQTGRI